MSCATLSAEPLVRGKWLKKGAHVDLVGAYTPKMREADDDAIKKARASTSTRAPARTKEAGDIVQPLKSGVLKKDGIHGDLFELVPRRGEGPHRQPADHAVQVGRHRDRGSGRRDAGVVIGQQNWLNEFKYNWMITVKM